ncbi:unnamed protein product [Brassica oleracea var. botrytis]|uniref:Uncharacterized protein n=2 Tax=Brassica TaxID=3705 RepID=A0A3P6APK1_BRAOL|nr:unnamed protein product [Brassica napus]VDC94592.1 unnamed protein product [Brassica oleracea]
MWPNMSLLDEKHVVNCFVVKVVMEFGIVMLQKDVDYLCIKCISFTPMQRP